MWITPNGKTHLEAARALHNMPRSASRYEYDNIHEHIIAALEELVDEAIPVWHDDGQPANPPAEAEDDREQRLQALESLHRRDEREAFLHDLLDRALAGDHEVCIENGILSYEIVGLPGLQHAYTGERTLTIKWKE